jgi:hypothetical protein
MTRKSDSLKRIKLSMKTEYLTTGMENMVMELFSHMKQG